MGRRTWNIGEQGHSVLGMRLHGEVDNEPPELVIWGSMQAEQKQVEWPLLPVFCLKLTIEVSFHSLFGRNRSASDLWE